MKVTFYKCEDDNLNVNKSLIELFTIDNVVWKEDTSAYKPTISFRKTDGSKQANYVKMKILGFTKYFYIDNMILRKGGILEVELTCDVLMTYASDIRGIHTIVTRQEFKTDHTYNDNNIALSSKRIIDTVSLGNVGADNASLVLTVIN